MKLMEELQSVLKKDERLVSDDQLLKNKIVELGLKLDKDLIKLLSANKKIKEHFFTEIDKTLVFDKEKFMKFIDNKEFLPDSYTAFKNKIGLTVDKRYLSKNKEVVLSWPYKDCILEGGQEKEKEKRNEIFHNEILAPDEIDRLLEPKVFTNFKRIDTKGEHKVSDIKPYDNLIINGNNLLALHSLKKKYAEKIKLIYIDPPYNTGGANEIFTYNNNFNHSTWLTFMRNRLEIAKELLRKDGFVAITIDHVELFYLGVLADEIFGEENRAGIVTIIINPKGRQNPRYFSAIGEYMLIYAKDSSIGRFNNVVLDEEVAATFNLEDEKGKYRWENFINARTRTLRKNRPNHWYPIYVSKDLKTISLEPLKDSHKILPIAANKEYSWKLIKSSFKKILEEEPDYFSASLEKGKVNILHKFREQQRINNVWTDSKYFAEFHGTLLLKKMLGENIFSYPKSLYSVKDTIKLITKEDDIILDFFAGSGTTGHATLELNREDGGNRQFILVEQLNEHIKVINKRMKILIDEFKKQKEQKDVSFIYCEIKELNEEFIQQIKKSKDTKEILKVWEEMKKHAFLSYRVNEKLFDENIKEFKVLSVDEQKKLLINCLDTNNLYVNLSEMEDEQYKVSKDDKDLNKKFYGGL
ncbi:site-specific DNA-methyltransferase [Candidatus Woesearchaeota archaeon]|nr:site-specific DNA-methyltransferase [Candidatus Woesearchaeota archaeon]